MIREGRAALSMQLPVPTYTEKSVNFMLISIILVPALQKYYFALKFFWSIKFNFQITRYKLKVFFA